jgi:DNA-directed RNA polymerase subunit N (RpoN/RPB10)
MLAPIVCFTCGSPVGDKSVLFRHLRAARVRDTLAKRDTAAALAMADGGLRIDCSDILELLGIKHDCCRAHLITAMDYRDYY